MQFYVVTKPSKESTLIDVCFKADVKQMMLQALGGLRPDDVVLVTKSKKEAEEKARALLSLVASHD